MTKRNLRVLVIDKPAFLSLASIYNWKKTKVIFYEEGIKPLSTDRQNK
jgi:hypothetical protein